MEMVGTLIANHNYANYLEYAIDSALNQTIKNYVIVVDDGSTDNSVDVATNILKFDKIEEKLSMKFYIGKNGIVISLPKSVGPAEARNIGILSTLNQIKYYNILDADDVAYPNKIEKLLSKMSHDVAGVYGDYDIHNEDTGICIREYKEPYSLEGLNRSCIIHSGSLLNRDALLKVADTNGIYDRTMRVCEDYDLWLRLAKVGFIFKHIPESLSLVRTHQNNSTNSVDKKIWIENWEKIRKK